MPRTAGTGLTVDAAALAEGLVFMVSGENYTYVPWGAFSEPEDARNSYERGGKIGGLLEPFMASSISRLFASI